MRILIPFVFFSLLLVTTSIGQDVNSNLDKAAIYISNKVVEKLKTSLPVSGKHRVAVFAFGDKNRNHPKQMGDLGVLLQGQTISSLKDALANATESGIGLTTKFSALSYDQISAVFASSPGDVGGLNDQNIDLARSVLADARLDVGIVGHFKFDGSKVSAASLGDTATVSVTVILPSDVKTFDFKIKVSEILLHILPGVGRKPDRASRFKVEILAQPVGSSAFEVIPIQKVTDESHALFNTLILPVDKAKFEGRQYKIRITNNGASRVAYLDGSSPGIQKGQLISNTDAKEKDRVFLLAGYVDGVSTIKRRNVRRSGVESYDKDVRNYPMVRKYILTGPGRTFTPSGGFDSARFRDANLTDSAGFGHSQLNVTGFLKVRPDGWQSTGAAFVFGDSADSVGQEFVGTGVSQIGIISLYFFAEKYSDDRTATMASPIPAGAGTVEGDDLPTPTIPVGVKNIYPIPVETWHIIYRYKTAGDPRMTPITQ